MRSNQVSDAGTERSQRHSFYWRSEGRNTQGKRVVSACCPCGWVHMTAYPLLRKRSRVRYLRYRWMEHPDSVVCSPCLLANQHVHMTSAAPLLSFPRIIPPEDRVPISDEEY